MTKIKEHSKLLLLLIATIVAFGFIMTINKPTHAEEMTTPTIKLSQSLYEDEDYDYGMQRLLIVKANKSPKECCVDGFQMKVYLKGVLVEDNIYETEYFDYGKTYTTFLTFGKNQKLNENTYTIKLRPYKVVKSAKGNRTYAYGDWSNKVYSKPCTAKGEDCSVCLWSDKTKSGKRTITLTSDHYSFFTTQTKVYSDSKYKKCIKTISSKTDTIKFTVPTKYNKSKLYTKTRLVYKLKMKIHIVVGLK